MKTTNVMGKTYEYCYSSWLTFNGWHKRKYGQVKANNLIHAIRLACKETENTRGLLWVERV